MPVPDAAIAVLVVSGLGFAIGAVVPREWIRTVIVHVVGGLYLAISAAIAVPAMIRGEWAWRRGQR